MSGGRVLAVVVTYHSGREIEACLRALEAQRDVRPEIVVVDNASSDDTLARVRSGFPAVRILETGANLGYGRANNLVLLGEDADWYAIVNPDVVCPPDALSAALAVLVAEPDVGVVGLRQVAPGGEPLPVALEFPRLGTLLAELRPGPPRGGADPARPRDADWLAGSFLVARARAVRETGGFDPAIFMYGEDVDWCMRLARRGWRRRYLPAPVIVHAAGASAATTESVPAMYVEHLKNRLRFFDRYHGRGTAALARGLTALNVAARLLAHEVVALARPGAPGGSRASLRRAWAWVRRGMPLAAGRSAPG